MTAAIVFMGTGRKRVRVESFAAGRRRLHRVRGQIVRVLASSTPDIAKLRELRLLEAALDMALEHTNGDEPDEPHLVALDGGRK